MPDSRHHRGPAPEDAQLFSPQMLAPLQSATADLSWLLSRGYAMPSASKIVGDRYNLTQRQRTAIQRAACTDQALASRLSRRIEAATHVLVDGYNLLTTLEAALAGAVILACRDSTFRDIASIHGTWRRVDETIPALLLAGQFSRTLGLQSLHWYLDAPVSNSARLKAAIEQTARDHHFNWSVELVPDPDPILSRSQIPIVSADSIILDHCGPWLNLAGNIVTALIPTAWVIPLACLPIPAPASP